MDKETFLKLTWSEQLDVIKEDYLNFSFIANPTDDQWIEAISLNLQVARLIPDYFSDTIIPSDKLIIHILNYKCEVGIEKYIVGASEDRLKMFIKVNPWIANRPLLNLSHELILYALEQDPNVIVTFPHEQQTEEMQILVINKKPLCYYFIDHPHPKAKLFFKLKLLN